MQITNMICDRCTVFVCCLLLFQINWTWHWMSACWCTAHLSPESVINVSRGIHTHTHTHTHTKHTHTHTHTHSITHTASVRFCVHSGDRLFTHTLTHTHTHTLSHTHTHTH